MKTKIYTLNASDGEIRYVGKTVQTLEHRLQAHLYDAKYGVKDHRCNWIRSLLKKNELPTIHLLTEVEGDGCKEEIEKIAYFRAKGTRLVNSTDGGEGTVGWHHPKEVKEKISEAQKGNKNHNYGKHPSPKTLEKMSEVQKGSKNSFYGKHHSPKVLKEMSEAMKKYWINKKGIL